MQWNHFNILKKHSHAAKTFLNIHFCYSSIICTIWRTNLFRANFIQTMLCFLSELKKKLFFSKMFAWISLKLFFLKVLYKYRCVFLFLFISKDYDVISMQISKSAEIFLQNIRTWKIKNWNPQVTDK